MKFHVSKKSRLAIAVTLLVLLWQDTPLIGQSHNRQSIDSMQHALREMNPGKDKVKVLYDLSFAYTNIDPEQGIKYGEQAATIALKLGWKEGYATALAGQGANHRMLSDYATALKLQEYALAVYRELDKPNSIEAMLSNISLIYQSKAEYTKAMEYLFDALKINLQTRDSAKRAIYLENLGTIYFRMADHEKSEQQYRQALELHETLHDRAGMARCYSNLGMVLNDLDFPEESLGYTREALKISREDGNLHSASINMVNIGNAFMNLQAFDSALLYFRGALGISRQLKSRSGIATTLGNIGVFYRKQAEAKRDEPAYHAAMTDSAIRYLGRSIDSCEALSYSEPLVEFSKELSEIYEASGNFQQALFYLKLRDRHLDSINKPQKELKQMYTDAEQELSCTEKDMALALAQLQISELEDVNQREEIARWTMVLTITALAISLLLLLRKRRNQGA